MNSFRKYIVKRIAILKILIRRFVARYFGWLVTLIIKIYFKVVKLDDEIIIILTYGKVGSSSIEKTLKYEGHKNVFHIHWLKNETIEAKIVNYKKSSRKSVPLHLLISKHLSNYIEKESSKIKIITAVREPYGRRISGFFQDGKRQGKNIENKDLSFDYEKSIRAIKEMFKEPRGHLYEDEWFDSEIGRFGIDVFEKTMDNGYNIFRGKSVELLLFRLEDLDGCFSEAYSVFFNCLPVKLINSNQAENKVYYESYCRVKGRISLDPETLIKFQNTRFFKHFYSDMKAELNNKWKK